MLRSKLTAFIGAFIITGSVFASQDGLCPDINDIKAEGISMAEVVAPALYITYNISNYNTTNTWGFIIAPLQGEDEATVIDAANEVLSNMSAPGIPEQHGNAIICDYNTGRNDVFAAAINDTTQITPMSLKGIFQSKMH